MYIKLPPRIDGNPAETLKDIEQLTIIGANGSGKTRFAGELLRQCGDKAYRLSAIKALFVQPQMNSLPGSIDSQYSEVINKQQFISTRANTEFERLLFLMINDEFLSLLSYKKECITNPEAKPQKTRLDMLQRMWETIFPKNKILRIDGSLLFSNNFGNKPFNPMRLSDGEKAILYYIGGVLYAMPNAVILVEEPEIFLHRSVLKTLWDQIEQLRPDCTLIYMTHDLEFATSRTGNECVWVRECDAEGGKWDYSILSSKELNGEDLYLDLLGSRKPILFIEGDDHNSIDAKLYPLVFPEFMVKPLGSCDKVIEVTRTFNDMKSFHHLDSYGIIDRDRRTTHEVDALHARRVYIPEAAEVENLLLLEDVVRAVARRYHRNEDKVFNTFKQRLIYMFRDFISAQALQHTRYRIKREIEYKIDKRFSVIDELEDHLQHLPETVDPRGTYNRLQDRFKRYASTGNYPAILKVFNQKTIISECDLSGLLGLHNKDEYLRSVLNILKSTNKDATVVRNAIRSCFSSDLRVEPPKQISNQ